MSKTFSPLIVLLLCIGSTYSVWFRKDCNLPPSQWCSTPEIAERCQVLPHCKEYWRSDPSPVAIEVYLESMCPGCKAFTAQQLFPTWQKIKEVMNVTYVPYGNAQEKWDGNKWQFTCQHGANECVGNLIETCAMDVLKNVSKYLPFITCIEASDQLPDQAALLCAAKHKIYYSDIVKCANGSRGNDLEHQMAQMTDALQPPHQFVPWITINGVHTADIQQRATTDLLGLICETYKGEKPAACSSGLQKTCIRNY